MSKKSKKTEPHPLDIPEFLKRTGMPTPRVQDPGGASIRMPTISEKRDPYSGMSPALREEMIKAEAEASDVLRDIEEKKRIKKDNKFKRWKSIEATKVDPKTQRWDPQANRVVDARPFRNLDDLALRDLKFGKLTGPDLVRAYNELIYVAAGRGDRGREVVRRFSSTEVGRQRCEDLRKELLGGQRATPAKGGRTSAQINRGDTDMAKTAKKAKAKTAKKAGGAGTGKVRDKVAPAGKVADFKTVRAGTDRALLIDAIRGGTKKVSEVAAAIKKDPRTVTLILYFLNRDNGIGYTLKDESVSLQFPGSNTWQDAIKKEDTKAAA